MDNLISRRLFVRKWFFSGFLLGGAAALAGGCASNEKKSPGPAEKEAAAEEKSGPPSGPETNHTGDPCTDYSGVSEADLKIREAMGYVPLSTVEGKQCSNCNLYLPGTACGSCQLFKGPVTANGNCTYWAPQV
ncbi:MAG TPA: high-potential iron-sulfur protein [Saprospiraceae bacterium]|nr:high-potential iron-sulfur protein [Saprospiraceae bacterium]HNT20476.1 high-potential iron-sulfur protein [Saprospiraceae bacterium]